MTWIAAALTDLMELNCLGDYEPSFGDYTADYNDTAERLRLQFARVGAGAKGAMRVVQIDQQQSQPEAESGGA